jgi:hypothetical protein
VRRIVATVDNMPRKTYAQRLSPLKPAPGKFTVAGTDAQMAISPQNAARYAPLVRAFEAVNSEKLVALYVRFYPLFQEAYREQGYPNAYFNDRLVQVLDLLIATREAPGQLAIAQPKVLYEFADPALEALPSGQNPAHGPKRRAREGELRGSAHSWRRTGRRRRQGTVDRRQAGPRRRQTLRRCHRAADGHRRVCCARACTRRAVVLQPPPSPAPASGDPAARLPCTGDAPFRRAYRAFQSDADRKPVSANRSRVGKVGSSGAMSVTRPDLMSCRRTTNPIATTTAAKIRNSSIVGISTLSSRDTEHPRRM